jgi:hypothetical protein
MKLCAALVAVHAAAVVSAQVVHESPFYCNLSVLTSAARAHKAEIAGTLSSRRTGVRELADGYEFSFRGDDSTLALLNDWISTERLCCPFFDFSVRIGREGGAIALRLSGRPGTKEFIRADFVPWLK